MENEHKTKKEILKNWKGLRQNLNSFVKNIDLKELQQFVKENIKNVHLDFNTIFENEVSTLKKKFQSEKEQLEKKVNTLVKIEIDKAKKFVDKQKKEIDKLQKKIDKHLKKSAPKTAKKKGIKSSSPKPRTSSKKRPS